MPTTDNTIEPIARTITMTGRKPIKIHDDEWPIIAVGLWKDWDNTYECQANCTWKLVIRVRQRADGRTVVYGVYEYDTCWQGRPNFEAKVGLFAETDEKIPETITRVGALLRTRLEDADEDAGRALRHITEVVAECIGDLPAEEL